MTQLKAKLESGQYVVTSEIAPPKGPDLAEFLDKARIVKGRVVAVNVTDNQRSIMRLSSLIACECLLREGVEPIYQLACRDRNRLALQSDLLGAAAVGIKNVLPLTGDPVSNGDQKESKAVFDLNSVKLMSMIEKLNQGLAYNDKPLNGKTHFYVGGAVDPNNFGTDAFKFKFEQKIKNGARFFQSQPLYDLKKGEQLFKYCEELGVKILIGVILIKSEKQAEFLNKIPGIKIPPQVIQKFAGASDPLQVGIEYAAQEIRELKPISHGVHVMTVGREELVPEILRRAGI
jgi:methylenetetrahydrofolate reductase (NADPH)